MEFFEVQILELRRLNLEILIFFLAIDNQFSLGITNIKNSISYYKIGNEIKRNLQETKIPELLPFGYFVNETNSIEIYLNNNNFAKAASKILISKNYLQKYAAVLFENKNCLIGSYEDKNCEFSWLLWVGDLEVYKGRMDNCNLC